MSNPTTQAIRDALAANTQIVYLPTFPESVAYCSAVADEHQYPLTMDIQQRNGDGVGYLVSFLAGPMPVYEFQVLEGTRANPAGFEVIQTP